MKKSNLIKYFPKKMLLSVVKKYGTPTYVYSEKLILKQIETYKKYFDKEQCLICYAMKANSNKSFVSVLAENGLGADVVSGGELYRALKAGVNPKKIIFSGVGKTKEEIQYAIEQNILFLNIESSDELETVKRLSEKLKKDINVSFRINPNVDAHTHKYITTGKYDSKFGIPAEEAIELYHKAFKSARLHPIAIHSHIGSQINSVLPYQAAAEKILKIVDKLAAAGISLEYVDIGGGWGAEEGFEMKNPSELKRISDIFIKKGLKVIIEPGRSLSAPCGLLISKVINIKEVKNKHFVIVDAGMNDLLRPSLYGVEHPVEIIGKTTVEKYVYDIVGPVCESSDFFVKNAKGKMPKKNSFIAIMSAGAYGFSMSSQYNSRPRAAEVMLRKDKIELARLRETYKDLTSCEI